MHQMATSTADAGVLTPTVSEGRAIRWRVVHG
jgi:hypothetical protein